LLLDWLSSTCPCLKAKKKSIINKPEKAVKSRKKGFE
jgi:hypothetical protein